MRSFWACGGCSLADIEEELESQRALPGWKPLWLTMLSDFCGGFMALDLKGEYGGPVGQILLWDHEEQEPPEVVYESIDALIATMLVAVEQEVLDNEDDFEEIYEAQNPGFPHRGDQALRQLIQQLQANEDDPERVIALSDTALELSRDDDTVWALRHNALLQLGRLPEAVDCLTAEIEILERAEAAAPDSAKVLARLRLRRAELQAQIGMHDQAHEEACALVQLTPQAGFDRDDLVGAWSVLRDSAEALGLEQEARDAGQKVAELSGGTPEEPG